MQQVFDRYLNYLTAERNASRYTVRNYATDLLGGTTEKGQKGFFQFLRLKNVDTLDHVDRQVIRDYLGWLMEQGVVRNSINRRLSAIKSFFRYLVREDILPSNPAEMITSSKRDQYLPSILSAEEVVRLLEAPDLSKADGLRDRALLELLYASGLRVSEVVSLDLGQVDLDAGEIRVRGKGSKERVVLMGKPAARALTAYLTRGRAVGLRDRALMELLCASGFRVSELVSLDLGEVDLDAGEIRVRGKGSKERVVLMGKSADQALTAYLAHGRPELLGEKSSRALFVGQQGERLTGRRVQKTLEKHARPELLGEKSSDALFLGFRGEQLIERMVQKILEKHTRAAGIGRKIHPHVLRHTFATHMLDGGADLRVVQELLGHADLSSTQIYTQVSKSQARKVYLSAHPLAKARKEDEQVEQQIN